MPFTTEGTTIAGGLIVTDANTSRTMPVELLRDRRGVYGIGVSDLFDFEGWLVVRYRAGAVHFRASPARSDPAA